MITIDVVIATREKQRVVSLEVPEGTTVLQAVQQSGLQSDFPDFDLVASPKGIWSRPQPDDTEVQQGDRVEVYRPLVMDAKAARRARAEKSVD